MSRPGDLKIGMPLAYRGKAGCQNVTCTRDGNPDRCYGWHCPYCHEPCGMMGHRCAARVAAESEGRAL